MDFHVPNNNDPGNDRQDADHRIDYPPLPHIDQLPLPPPLPEMSQQQHSQEIPPAIKSPPPPGPSHLGQQQTDLLLSQNAMGSISNVPPGPPPLQPLNQQFVLSFDGSIYAGDNTCNNINNNSNNKFVIFIFFFVCIFIFLFVFIFFLGCPNQGLQKKIK